MLMIDSSTLLFFSAKTDRGVGGSLTPSDRTPTMEESYTPICLNAYCDYLLTAVISSVNK